MAKILGIGNSVLDIILTTSHFPHEDEEMRAVERKFQTGGNVNNTLYILSQLGHETSIITTISNDDSAKKILADFKARQINTVHLQRFIKGQTPTSYVLLNQQTGSRTITHIRELPEVSFDHFAKIEIENYDWLHFEGRNIENLKGMMNIAKTFLEGQPISLEVEKQREGIEELIPMADVIIFSHHYAKQAGFQNAVELLKAQQQNAPEAKLVCTWGKLGAWYCDKQGEIKHQAAQRIPQTIDTLGVGDTFNAGLIDSLSQGKTLAEATLSATKLAAQKCQRIGLDDILTNVVEKKPLANIEQVTNSKVTIVPCADLAHSVILIKHETGIKAYLNNCPHQDIPLNEAYKIDVNPFEKTIKCSVHDAYFNVDDGCCTEGPCINEELEAVAITVDDNGDIFLA